MFLKAKELILVDGDQKAGCQEGDRRFRIAMRRVSD